MVDIIDITLYIIAFGIVVGLAILYIEKNK